MSFHLVTKATQGEIVIHICQILHRIFCPDERRSFGALKLEKAFPTSQPMNFDTFVSAYFGNRNEELVTDRASHIENSVQDRSFLCSSRLALVCPLQDSGERLRSVPLIQQLDLHIDTGILGPVGNQASTVIYDYLELQDMRRTAATVHPSLERIRPSRSRELDNLVVAFDLHDGHGFANIHLRLPYEYPPSIPIYNPDDKVLRVINVWRDIHGWRCVSQQKIGLFSLLRELAPRESQGQHSGKKADPATCCRKPRLDAAVGTPGDVCVLIKVWGKPENQNKRNERERCEYGHTELFSTHGFVLLQFRSRYSITSHSVVNATGLVLAQRKPCKRNSFAFRRRATFLSSIPSAAGPASRLIKTGSTMSTKGCE